MFLYWRRILFAGFFVLAAILYAMSLGQNRVVNEAGVLFDLYIVLLLIWAVFHYVRVGIERETLRSVAGVFLTFVFYTIFYIILEQDFILFEYARSIRFLFYLAVFIFISGVSKQVNLGRGQSDFSDFIRFGVLLVLLFFVLYVFKRFILGYARPWAFSENNFEMALVIILSSGLMAVIKSESVVGSKWWLMFFRIGAGVLAVLSFSKSALLAAIFMVLRSFKLNNILIVYAVAVLFVISLVGIWIIFSLRVGDEGFASMDRFLFLMVFWDEWTSGPILSYIFGNGPAKELSENACGVLSFWVGSMFRGESYCNAAIFHSFFIRIMYEYGLLVTVAFLAIWYRTLVSVYGRQLGLTFFGLICINSLSVSGFSNSIVLWPIFILLPIGHYLRSKNETV